MANQAAKTKLKTVACIASGPTLTQEVFDRSFEQSDALVLVSDSFRLAGQHLGKVAAHVSTDVRWWNEWAGGDFHNRIQHGDSKPYTGIGSVPKAWKETPTGQAYLRTCGHKKLHSGALGLMVAGEVAGSGGVVVLVSHDLELKDPGHAHFFGNHPQHPGWGTPNPTEGNLPLYREQISRARDYLKKWGVSVVCGTPSSLCSGKIMKQNPLPLISW